MRAISAYLKHVVSLALTRWASFLVDVLVLCVPVAVSWFVLRILFGLNPDFAIYFWVIVATAFAHLESKRDGQTPGKFLFKLRALEIERPNGITFYASFGRLSTFFFGGLTIYSVELLFYEWYGVPVFFSKFLVIHLWLLILLLYPFVRTGGRMALHDVIFGTSVDFLEADRPKLPLNKIRREVWILAVILVALHVGLLTVVKHGSTGIRQEFDKRGAEELFNSLEDRLGRYFYSTAKVSNGVDGFFRYFRGDYQYIGSLSFGLLDQNIELSRRGSQIGLHNDDMIPVFQVFVTGAGFVSPHNQELVAENFLQLVYESDGSSAALVEFVYPGALLNLIFPAISRRIFVFSSPIVGGDIKSQTIWISPKESGRIEISTAPQPVWELARLSMNQLRRRD